MTSAAKKRHEQLKREAHDAFADHEIRYSEEEHGRWLLQGRDKAGHWTGVFAAEVVALWGGRIYVGGDIQGVEFAYGPIKRGPRCLIRWMGECTDIGYYVAQKAAIGSASSRNAVEVFDAEVATEELKALCDAERQELSEYDDGDDCRHSRRHKERIEELEEIIERGCFDEHELHVALSENLDSDFLCDLGAVGMVLNSKVHYAHAAMARLCEIWKVQAANGCPHHGCWTCDMCGWFEGEKEAKRRTRNGN